mmetsp:Transcript_115015/g.228969  ORF Transcript_115015/g.228969 Transcript_115015/m.228969 type:complete len:212 (-) Transcript_115015:142-777(-)
MALVAGYIIRIEQYSCLPGHWQEPHGCVWRASGHDDPLDCPDLACFLPDGTWLNADGWHHADLCGLDCEPCRVFGLHLGRPLDPFDDTDKCVGLCCQRVCIEMEQEAGHQRAECRFVCGMRFLCNPVVGTRRALTPHGSNTLFPWFHGEHFFHGYASSIRGAHGFSHAEICGFCDENSGLLPPRPRCRVCVPVLTRSAEYRARMHVCHHCS